MTLASPWALAGLAALPVLAWLHRRRRRPAPVDLPSLLFLEGEPPEPERPDRWWADLDLLLALAAAACLVSAAAGLEVSSGAAGRTVRVVSYAGPRAAARRAGSSVGERIRAEVERIRAGLAAEDVLRWEEVAGSDADLVSAARAGEAAVRLLVTDRLPAGDLRRVRVVAVGDPDAQNVGIVAATVTPGDAGVRVFANVWNDSSRARSVGVRVSSDGRGPVRPLDLAPRSARSVAFDLPSGGDDLLVLLVLGVRGVETSDGTPDDLPADDSVRLVRVRLRVGFARGAGGVPAAHERAVLDGLRAVVGADGVVLDDAACDLWVGGPAAAPPSTRRALVLRPIRDGETGLRPPPGTALEVADSPHLEDPLEDLLRDVDPTGCDLVFAPPAVEGVGFGIARRVRTTAPFDVVEFGPDPLAGHPAPADHALWPVFLENFVTPLVGRATGGAYRVFGVLDPEVSRLGRDAVPFDPAWLREGKPSGTPRRRALSPWLAVAAVALLLALWRRTGRRPLEAASA